MQQFKLHALLAGAGATPRRGLAGGIATCMLFLHQQGNDHAGAALTARLVDRGGLFNLLLQGDNHMGAVLWTRLGQAAALLHVLQRQCQAAALLHVLQRQCQAVCASNLQLHASARCHNCLRLCLAEVVETRFCPALITTAQAYAMLTQMKRAACRPYSDLQSGQCMAGGPWAH